ncbi:ABC transporter substrate-binding protein [uncultured Phycicoccus sp.]|uniref:ABC transporter substrate-binding protein n=1 Tax=uncultured Phycicoccus sp. TaxID=661422 RepID=UPI002630D9B8|nr:ABC transporter substrate-binding protein [uncultured Phycicoccus sp.]
MSYNAALTGPVNASDVEGGVLRYVRTDDFDSLDFGNTYYGYSWNFLRLLGRTMTTFAPATGERGREVVPDLAEGLGQSADGGRTWTYRLRHGLRFEDGSPVTAHDVRYAIERSNYGLDVLGAGPMYLRHLLEGEWDGPYADPDGHAPGIEVPDDHTIVFRLRRPFAAFDKVMTLPSCTPVPRDADTGAAYGRSPVATGPYRVESYEPGTRLRLCPNPHWDRATDPVRRRTAAAVEVLLGRGPLEVDELLLDGEAEIDLAGFGLQPESVSRVLDDPQRRDLLDNPLQGFTWIYCLVSSVAPMGNVHARRAVQYATDKAAMQDAYGGRLCGDIATTVLPPTIEGYADHDRYPVGVDGSGDLEAARRELALAGMPEGFSTKIAARTDRRKEYLAAEALSRGLARVGIDAPVQGFTSGGYFEHQAGSPEFLRENGIGIVMFGWGADFPDGYGFFQQIVDGRAIKRKGNQNMGELDDPVVNELLDVGAECEDPRERERIWRDVDRLVMDHAVIVPYLYPRSLLYRGPRATNVYVAGSFGMYDYMSCGATV